MTGSTRFDLALIRDRMARSLLRSSSLLILGPR